MEVKPPLQDFRAQGLELVLLDFAPDFLDFPQDLFSVHSSPPG